MSKVGRTIRIEESDLKEFERLYPELLPLYVQRAVHVAVTDRAMFEKIFFTGLPSVGNSDVIL